MTRPDEWLVPGLEYWGVAPPEGDGTEEEWFPVPRQPYIPISQTRLVRTLRELVLAQSPDASFDDFVSLLGLMYSVRYHPLLQTLKSDYEYFSLEMGDLLREGLSEEELVERQQRFLRHFLFVMLRANFQPFTGRDFREASEHHYLFDLPVTLQWERYDEQFLTDLGVAEHALPLTLKDVPQEFDGKAWIFFRGIGTDRIKGVFPEQKFDLYVSRILGFLALPGTWLVERLRGAGEDEQDALAAPGLADVSAAEAQSVQRRWIRRVNLSNQRRRWRDWLRIEELQEPSFERAISIFRLKPPRPPDWIDRLPLFQDIVRRFFPPEPTKERDWTIQLKMFCHIPMADSEMILPEKELAMRSSDQVILWLTGIAGLVTLLRGGLKGGSTLWLALISVFVAYAAKILFQYRRVRARYIASVTDTLYRKNLDNSTGVLEYLVDAVQEQELKEALLVYVLLWRARRPMTSAELDLHVEEFLCEHCGDCGVDFEIEDALDKVCITEQARDFHRLPLVEMSEDGGVRRYRAIPMDDALAIMDQRWDGMFEVRNDALDPGQSVVG